jgi:uncharacterized membrane protein (UPF0136 family)
VVISQMLLTLRGLISQLQKKSRSRLLAERLSGELFGLTFGLRTFGKKVSQRITQEDNQTTD